MSSLLRKIRSVVSGKRSRFVEGNYDLDLTYITDNMIAMGFPADSFEGLYRNHIDEVASFLKEKHGPHFMIFNLSEKLYDYSKFNGQVLTYGFPDHHNPPLDLLFTICKSMDAWVKADPENVAVVHCVAGKGRTGTVCSAYLLYTNCFATPTEAMAYFLEKRGEGVTSPSQKRYIEYFYYVLKNRSIPYPKPLVLSKMLILEQNPYYKKLMLESKLQLDIYEMVQAKKNEVHKRLIFSTSQRDTGLDGGDVVSYVCKSVVLQGDILMICKNIVNNQSIFRFAFHTAFIPLGMLRLQKKELDEAYKDKTLSDEFTIDLMFKQVDANIATQVVNSNWMERLKEAASMGQMDKENQSFLYTNEPLVDQSKLPILVHFDISSFPIRIRCVPNTNNIV